MMLNKMIRLFFGFGVPFGILMGIYYSFNYDGILPGILGGLVAGIVFGAIMAGVLGYLHVRSVKKKAGDSSNNDYDVNRSKEIELPVSYDEAYKLCIKSLDQLKKPGIKDKNYSQGLIMARTGKTWDTWGDKVLINLAESKDNKTHVRVSSKPAFLQVVDYGENLENVNNIISFLEEGSRS